MNRRHALLSIASAVAVAGCLGRVQSTPPSRSTPITDGSGAEPSDANDASAAEPTYNLPDPPFRGMRAEPAATYSVGVRTGTAKATPGAHVVQVWNDGDNTREVAVFIAGAATGVQFDRTVDIDPGDHLNFAFQSPDIYTVKVSGDGFSSQSSVERDWNECSTSMTTMRIRENGTETKSVSESGDCQA